MNPPALTLSPDGNYIIINPGIEASKVKFDSTPADETATTGLALQTGTNKVVTKTLPPGAIGDVTGPATSTDQAIARFNGITGKVIQNSNVTLSSTGVITFVAGGPGGLVLPNPTGLALGPAFDSWQTGGVPAVQILTGPWLTNQNAFWDIERIGNRVFVSIGIVPSLNDGGAAAPIKTVVPLPTYATPIHAHRSGVTTMVNAGVPTFCIWFTDFSGIITFALGADPTATFPVGSTGLTGGQFTNELAFFCD